MKYAIRSMFIAPKGYQFLAMDLSQAESWVVAYLAKEQNMKDALLNDDIHKLTASVLFNKDKAEITKEERYVGKRCNHALAYRMSAERLYGVFNKDAQESGVTLTLQEARVYRERWHSFYLIKQWWSEIESDLKNSRSLSTVYGRRRTFYGRWGEELFKEATAFLPQATVADHALGAIQPGVERSGGVLAIWKWAQQNHCKVVHTAHDSVMLEIPTNREREIVEEIYPLFYRPLLINGEQFTIPVEAEYGERWGEFEAINVS